MKRILIILTILLLIASLLVYIKGRIPLSTCGELPCEMRQYLCLPCPQPVDPTVRNQ